MWLWLIWAVLSVIWGLQALLALLVHRGRPAVVMFGMAILFGVIGSVVRRRTAPGAHPKSR
jgi:hypothetical protein